MSNGELAKLLDNIPVWATAAGNHETCLEINAAPELVGGVKGKSYELKICSAHGQVTVSEKVEGTKLPKACPERHINGNGTFCLGVNAGRAIESESGAVEWWRFLEEFLQCQQTAEKHGRWPQNQWLSHGNAAYYHRKLDAEAKRLGWEETVNDALNYQVGWLANDLPTYWNLGQDKTTVFMKQRALCPIGCVRKGRPARIRHCRHKAELPLIVVNEAMRRVHEKLFIKEYKAKGFQCCGSMINCPFK